jgi:hypothetical protein
VLLVGVECNLNNFGGFGGRNSEFPLVDCVDSGIGENRIASQQLGSFNASIGPHRDFHINDAIHMHALG